MSTTRRNRCGEAGGLRSCLIVLIAGALLMIGGFAYLRASGTPDLGPAPDGQLDGSDEHSIAVAMATKLAPALVLAPHATATLSERDLTVLVRQHDPDPTRFRDPEVRARDGRLLLSARTSLGPFDVLAVGRLRLSLIGGAGGDPDIRVDIEEVDAGNLTLPEVARARIEDRIQTSSSLRGVLSSSPELTRLRPYLDCVRVAPDGVVLGFHRPGTSSDPGGCG